MVPGDIGGRLKRGMEPGKHLLCNRNMHHILHNMMKPIMYGGGHYKLYELCILAGLSGLRDLSRAHNTCFKWMLGQRDHNEGDPTRCKISPDSVHPPAKDVPDDYTA